VRHSSSLMRGTSRQLAVATLFAALCAGATGQATPTTLTPTSAPERNFQAEPAATPTSEVTLTTPSVAKPSAVQLLQGFRPSDAKFDVSALMDILRDKRHEGWVLAAYPDPKTSRPLIGAGFTLDLPAREHPQTDPLNPHSFLEPSSAELWQAAGLDSDHLQAILSDYNKRLAAWKKKGFRRKIATLTPQISDDDADGLLRVSIIQSIYNAKAYCRNFDQLTAPQQMALSQLVYQMGVNLAEFSEFLALINSGSNGSTVSVQAPQTLPSAAPANTAATTSVAVLATSTIPAGDAETPALSAATANPSATPAPALGDRNYWNSVQHSLIESQWARLYRTRAVAVIAMLDPAYNDSPSAAERQVSAVLRPTVAHRHRGRAGSLTAVASNDGNSRSTTRKRKVHARAKRKA